MHLERFASGLEEDGRKGQTSVAMYFLMGIFALVIQRLIFGHFHRENWSHIEQLDPLIFPLVLELIYFIIAAQNHFCRQNERQSSPDIFED